MIAFKNKQITKNSFNSVADANDFILDNWTFLFSSKYNYTIRPSFCGTHIIIFNLDTNKLTKKLHLENKF